MQFKKQQLKPDVEQWTGSKLGNEYVKAVYCHPAYLTYMQSTSWEMPDWMKHKLESSFWYLPGEISRTSDTKMTPPLWQNVKKELKSLLIKVKEEQEAGLKHNIQNPKIMASGPITSCQIDGETMETVTDYFEEAPKSLQMVTAAMKLKHACSLKEKLWPTKTAY